MKGPLQLPVQVVVTVTARGNVLTKGCTMFSRFGGVRCRLHVGPGVRGFKVKGVSYVLVGGLR